MTIGERIKKRRLELGMTQDELAKKLGYKSRSSVNKLELNSRNLKPPKIKEIADALLTSPEYIMGWEKPKGDNPDLIFLESFIKNIDPDTLKELRIYAEYLYERRY